MTITRLGFGSWAIGGGGWNFGWGPQDDDESIAAIRHAIERGINWIDTAAIYGFGHSEEIVAKALEPYPEADRPYVFTKCGMRPNPTGPMEPNIRSGRRDTIIGDVEASLRRLKVDRIDLMQMHWPAPDAPVEEYWGALLELQAQGKIRACGLSNHGVDQLERAEPLGHVASLQPPFSLIRREVAADIIPWCVAHRSGVIVYSPMQAGLLTGAFSAQRVASLPSDDWRARNAEFQSPKLEANLALVDAMRPIAQRHGVSLAALAIAWTLTFDGVTGAIVGSRRPEQIDGWIAAGELELDDTALADLAQALDKTGAGAGPTSPRPGRIA